jgi:hypothetical protein
MFRLLYNICRWAVLQEMPGGGKGFDNMKQTLNIGLFCLLLASWAAAEGPKVRMMRVPEGGIQPQVAVDFKWNVHLLYYKGPEARGDLFYVKATDEGVGATWSTPIRVNSQPGSAIAIGTIRGGHIAVGKDGRVHVAWMGADGAEPKPTGTKATPMLYARMNDAGTAFEPQKNVITKNVGLDGGGSVAADGLGNVYVAWHASPKGKEGEASRTVWIARSKDQGKTFEPETRAWDEPTGVCGCCGMRIFTPGAGDVLILYRAAKENVHRDMYLLSSTDGRQFKGEKVGNWEIGKCVMSSASFGHYVMGTKAGLAAWESEDQVYFATAEAGSGAGKAIAPPGKGNNRKHPVAAANQNWDVLLAWTEETAWNKGGKLVWQVFDHDGKPVANGSGKADGVPVWSLPAAFSNGPEFVIIY